MAEERTEAWYVQSLIDNLRVPHNITPEMGYMEAIQTFYGFASIVKDIVGIVTSPSSSIPAIPSRVVGVTGLTEECSFTTNHDDIVPSVVLPASNIPAITSRIVSIS